jgi:AcrR family transcriptional regulator
MRDRPANPSGQDDESASADGGATSPFERLDSTLDKERYAHFHAISPEKQQRIIQVALEEFANRDYASVSTNVIVERAHISKGLLFHYFGNKQGLYLYLLDHVAQTYYTDFETQIDLEHDDIFSVMQKGTEAKLDMTTHDVLVARLFMRAMTDNLPSQAREFLNQTVDRAYDAFALMVALLDEGKLREGLDRDMVAHTISWACEGLVNHLLATVDPQVESTDCSQMMEYTARYFDFLRRLFYR